MPRWKYKRYKPRYGGLTEKKLSHRVPPFEFFEIDTDPSCTFDVLLMNRGITGFTVSRTSAVSEVNGDFGLKTQMFPNLRVERSYCPKNYPTRW